MISYQEALNIAENNIPWNCALFRDEIIEKPYGWYFCYQSKKFIETKNISDMLVGSDGFLVEKETGKVVEFGSAFSSEENFKIYEKGLIGHNDLVILKVREVNESVRLLNRLQMKNFAVELADDIQWKIHKTYSEKQIREKILKLPCVFRNQDFFFKYEEFEKIDKSNCLDYELRKSVS